MIRSAYLNQVSYRIETQITGGIVKRGKVLLMQGPKRPPRSQPFHTLVDLHNRHGARTLGCYRHINATRGVSGRMHKSYVVDRSSTSGWP